LESVVSAITRVRLPRFSTRRLRRPRPRTLLAVAFVVMVLGGGWLWVRGSSLVSVDRVVVVGLQGQSSGEIRSALMSAGRTMTTLDVDMSALRAAVAPFPVVKDLSVSTQFPHGMRIRVIELVPVGALSAGGRKVSVAASGKLLPSVNVSGLPSIPVTRIPGDGKVSAGAARDAVALLAAAPAWLRARVTQVSTTSANGLVAEVRNGPRMYFGDASRLRAKWTAAASVLADPSSQGAAYIDVSVPQRPAAGGVAGSATTAQSTAPAGTTGTGAATSTGAPTTGTGTATGTGTPTTPTGTGAPASATGAVGPTGAGGTGLSPTPATAGGTGG
jgi:cell division protein FtsQ